jgi:hypothetical protein
MRRLASVAVILPHDQHQIPRSHMAAKIGAELARERAVEAVREADRAEAHPWSLRMEGFVGPAQPSPMIAQCLAHRR